MDISSSPYQLGQSLVNAATSTYHNLLTVTSGDVENYIGSFSCTVSNSRGSSQTQSLDINGLLSCTCVAVWWVYSILFADLVIGNEGPHQSSSSINITCSSNLSVETIRWLNTSDGEQELFKNSGQQQLILSIEEVTLSLHNTMYTCEVKILLAEGLSTFLRENITVQLIGMAQKM